LRLLNRRIDVKKKKRSETLKTEKVSKELVQMLINQDSPAAAVARAHVEAFTNHDFETARSLLAEDVHFTLLNTEPDRPNLVGGIGVEQFMELLTQQPLTPGSAQFISSVGDERHALLLVSVKADIGGVPLTIFPGRHYLLDDKGRIKTEQVVIFTHSD
jgi:hypothetical protein